LYDNLTHTEIPAGTAYNYNALISDLADRFSFKEVSMGIENVVDGFSFTFYNNSLQYSAGGIKTEIYTIQGQKVLFSNSQNN
jgi:hypothetical protein